MQTATESKTSIIRLLSGKFDTEGDPNLIIAPID
jgi:hypothetical protein